MKAFTDLEQSQKLAEILPLESADMWFHPYPNDEYWYDVPNVGNADLKYNQLPCWSLAALIDILPADWWGYTEHYFLEISKMGDVSAINEVRYYRHRKDIDGANYSRITHISHTAENLIDACVNMIITLYEHKLLNK